MIDRIGKEISKSAHDSLYPETPESVSGFSASYFMGTVEFMQRRSAIVPSQIGAQPRSTDASHTCEDKREILSIVV